MGFVAGIFDWFREPDNRGAVQVLAGLAVIAVAWATGVLRWLAGLLWPKPTIPPSASGPSQRASGGGVNVGGSVAGNVVTQARKNDDPS